MKATLEIHPSGLIALLAWGLVKMRRWAYYLNWVYLILPVAMQLTGPAVSLWRLIAYIGVWAMPNYIYFDKRRHLFGPAVLRSGR